MSSAQAQLRKVESGQLTGDKRAIGYYPMSARNFHTNRLEEVVLVDPIILQDKVAVESFPELRADLNRAFARFNQIQKRVLYRVLVQGQSIRTATRGLKKTEVWWWAWITREALPQLRERLKDYHDGKKIVLG